MDQQNLLVRFRLDNQQAISQATAFERAIRDQNKAMQGTATAARSYGQATAGVGKNAKAIKLFAQQASFQVADFAIVLSQGQGFLRAFAVQGGQLLGFLPGYGAVIGGVVTVVGLLGAALVEALSQTRSFDDALKDLQSTTADFVDTASLAVMSTKDIADEYKLFTNQAKTLEPIIDLAYITQQQSALKELQSTYRSFLNEVSDSTGFEGFVTLESIQRMREITVEIDALSNKLANTNDQYESISGQNAIQKLIDEFDSLNTEVLVLQQRLQISDEELNSLVTSMNALGQAETSQEMAQAMAAFAEAVLAANIDAKDLEEVLGENAVQMLRIGQEIAAINGAINEAENGFTQWRTILDGILGVAAAIADKFRKAAQDARDASAAATKSALGKAIGLENRADVENVKQATLEQTGSEYQANIAAINREFEIRNQLLRESGEIILSDLPAAEAALERERQASIDLENTNLRRKEYNDALRKSASGAKSYSQSLKEAEAAQKRFDDLVKKQKEASSVTFFDIASAGIDGFVDALFDADKSFKDFARDFLITVGKMIAKQFLLNWLVTALGGGKGPTLVQGVSQAQMLGMQAVNAIPFAKGGIIGAPSYFMNQGKLSQAGEAGPEAIMPLSRTSSGDLGVAGPSIVVNNYTGQEVSIDRTEEIIAISVGQARKAVESDFSRQMASGQGVYPRSLESGYSSRRRVK